MRRGGRQRRVCRSLINDDDDVDDCGAPPEPSPNTREGLEDWFVKVSAKPARPWDQADWDRRRKELIEKYSRNKDARDAPAINPARAHDDVTRIARELRQKICGRPKDI